MHYTSQRSFSPSNPLFSQLRRWQKPVGIVLLATGLATIASAVTQAPAIAQTFEVPVAQASMLQATAATHAPMEDGVYLYGESPQPQQIGSAYMVFEVSDRNVVGAFYMPDSSFDCFHGNVQANQLALTVVSSEDQTAYPYAVAMQPSPAVATVGNVRIAPAELAGYHAIGTVSDLDHQILATCRADLNGQKPQATSAGSSLQGQD